MISPSTNYRQIPSSTRVIEQMPDGSTAIYDSASGTVHSLNATAAAAFLACATPGTSSELAARIAARTGTAATEDATRLALEELEQAGLVKGSEAPAAHPDLLSRRAMLKAAGVALPVVLTLTAAQQRAYAQVVGSGTPAILGLTPDDMNCAETVDNVLLTGQNTHFGPGSVVTSPAPWLTISNVTVVSATQIRMTLRTTVAASGTVDITVTTGAEVVTGVRVLRVFACV